MGHAVIMGRKTFESIGKPLPGRFNVILSTDKSLQIPECRVTGNLSEAIQCCEEHEKCFIIGGHSIYLESMALADTILLSILDREYEGDTFFPPIPEKHFQQISTQRMGGEQPFTLHIYRRKTVA